MSRDEGTRIKGSTIDGQDRVLSGEALEFLAALHRKFDAQRRDLLAARKQAQKRRDQGERPDFSAETAEIRDSDWTIRGIPDDLQDRRVEITGPVDRKMVINALNSGAKAFMADFEDANTPTWANQINGQLNLYDAVRRDISFDDPNSGKHYELKDDPAVLIVRPRGWHLDEKHVEIDGEPMSGSLFDFGLFFFHNAKAQIERGTGPYFYIPKLESAREARLWNDVFVHAQETLGLDIGTIKATVLIETIPAVFQMDEILYELRDHIAGLNCGRWDYIFSFIKVFAEQKNYVLPDRDDVGMTRHFLHSYSKLLIRTCHRRGAFAMGGMAAQIPIRSDTEANEAAIKKVQADKEREAGDGHDGTWVAHPGLVPVAKEIFDKHMPSANQLDKTREDVDVTTGDLLKIPDGERTDSGLRKNINVALRYLAAWLGGLGCVPLDNLMEDAATAEISRAQIWQWRRHGASLSDGRTVDDDLIEKFFEEEIARVHEEHAGAPGIDDHLDEAAELLREMVYAPEMPDFLTLPAYERVIAAE